MNWSESVRADEVFARLLAAWAAGANGRAEVRAYREIGVPADLPGAACGDEETSE